MQSNIIKSCTAKMAQPDKQSTKAMIQHSNLYDVKLPFTFKLHELLDGAGVQGYAPIISWLPHGKAFRVHQPKLFADFIMPRFFKQSKYKSFQRQLHIYGFRRINSKSMVDFGAYYHEMFVRGEKDASLMMQRQPPPSVGTNSSKKGGSGSKSQLAADPDFYSQTSSGAPAPIITTSCEDTKQAGVPQRRAGVNTTPFIDNESLVDTVALAAQSKLQLLTPGKWPIGASPHMFNSISSTTSPSFNEGFKVVLHTDDEKQENKNGQENPLLPTAFFQPNMEPERFPQPLPASSFSSDLACPDLQSFQQVQQSQDLMQGFYDLQTLLLLQNGNAAGMPTTTNLQQIQHFKPVRPVSSPPVRPPSPFTEACNAIFD